MKPIQLVAALAAMLFMSAVIADSHKTSKVKKDDAQAAPVYEYVL
jgi:hypothetical protein